jgi:hypothetical protein
MPAFGLPVVQELPLALEPVASETFGGLTGAQSHSTKERSVVKTRRRTRRRRIVAAVLAALVVPVVPAAALAVPADTQYPRPAPQTGGPMPSDFTAPAAKTGDTPAEFAQPVAPAPKVGDTKSDSPGASRAPQYELPRTIQVVRPERTIVRDTDRVLPIALSGAALLIALGLAGTALIRVRSLRLG